MSQPPAKRVCVHGPCTADDILPQLFGNVDDLDDTSMPLHVRQGVAHRDSI